MFNRCTFRSGPRLVSAALVLLAVLPAATSAQPLADHLPARAVVYIGWSGSEDLGPGYDQSHLKAMIQLSQIDKMVTDVLPQIVAKFGDEIPDEEGQQAAEFLSTVGVAMWRHPTAFYFGGVDFSTPVPSPQIALVCDAGEDAAVVHDRLAEILAQAGDAPFPVVLRKLGTRVVLAVGNLDANQQGALGLVQTVAVVPRLAGDKVFQAAVAQTVKNPALVAYLDGERLLELIDTGIEKTRPLQEAEGELSAVAGMDWPQIKDALGLDGLKRAIFGAGIDGRLWGTRCFIEAPAPRRGLLALLDQQSISNELLVAVPASASMAGGFGFDLAGLVETVKQVAAKFDPGAAAAIEGGIAQANQVAQFDVIEDLLKPLGSEWVFYIDEETGSSGAFGGVVVNRLRDAQRFKQTLDKVEAAANAIIAAQTAEEKFTVRVKSVEIDGTDLHYVAVPLLSPCWAIRDGNLYLALQPQFVASAAQHVVRGGPSIAENPKFVAAKQQLGATRFGSFSFVDLQKTAPDSYSMITAVSRLFVGLADMAGIEDTPTMMVPPMYQLRPHLQPAASFSIADDNGYYLRSVEPFPGSGMFAVGTTGGWASLYAMMLPALAVSGISESARTLEFEPESLDETQ